MEGGGGARGGGWGHLWKLPWSPPRSRGGRVTRPVRSGCAGGGSGAVTLGRGRHARVHGHSAPCPNIPPRWPFLVCGRGVAGGTGPCF